MRDLINYGDGIKWKWRKGNSHFDVKVTKAERNWKKFRRHQYKDKPVTA